MKEHGFMFAHRLSTLIVAVALTIALGASPRSASADVAKANERSAPASVSTVGVMRVEKYGSGSPALVFIPGLMCGSWVWNDAVRRFASTHAVYVVTLAGFDGVPVAASPGIDAADDALVALLDREKLERPILIGHSLGGFLALRFGELHPARIGGIVSVDGTPVFPALSQATAAQRSETATAFGAQLEHADDTQFATLAAQAASGLVTDPAQAALVGKRTATADHTTASVYARELLSSDLRPALATISAPVLEIAPVPTEPAAYEGPLAASMSVADRTASYSAFYTSLFAATPHVTIKTIANSKHFVMIDQPAALDDAIAAFLATLKT